MNNKVYKEQKDIQFPVGAHFSIAKGYKTAFSDAVSVGASAIQIFSKNPMAAKFRKVTEKESEEVKEFKSKNNIKYAVIHASYLLNFARPLEENSFPMKSLAEDLCNADKLGAEGVVLHSGKSLTMDKGEAEDNFVANIKIVLEKTAGLKAKIIIENTASQGTEMGFLLPDLERVFKKLGKDKRVKFCFDTAHAYGAGYDLWNTKSAEKVAEEIDKTIGIKNIACIHLNDSKKELGSRVDRHEDIGHGTIGKEGLKSFIKAIFKKSDKPVPLILETPQDFESYLDQIKKVKNWVI
ncbi:MAG: deoxyribonuclease IV [Parcubacteria group bacterium]|nr:deoxyribonuclease IV [Parcubacteria group bacterium]MCR4343100.1 deoxyribonuclease IV [Patescibacteria group bacterium]